MAIDGKYGVITTEKKQLHPDEPVFLLRATDPLAAQAIRQYADACELAGCSEDHIEAVMEHARRIVLWQDRNRQLVKKRPD